MISFLGRSISGVLEIFQKGISLQLSGVVDFDYVCFGTLLWCLGAYDVAVAKVMMVKIGFLN